jgi:5'-phosphate synthase pdxT subunit
MLVGVLALQGDFQAHAAALEQLGASTRRVRTAADLDGIEGLVLPGGESTSMLKLMEPDRLDRVVEDWVTAGRPVLATCAGTILLASRVEPYQRSLGLLDISIERNAYGPQVHSAVASIVVNGEFGGPAEMEAVFIRAPRIRSVGDDVRVLGRLGEDPVLVSSGSIIAATFHPELSDDHRVHGVFCKLVNGGQS